MKKSLKLILKYVQWNYVTYYIMIHIFPGIGGKISNSSSEKNQNENVAEKVYKNLIHTKV